MDPRIKALLALKIVVAIALLMCWAILGQIRDFRLYSLAMVALVVFPVIATAMIIVHREK